MHDTYMCATLKLQHYNDHVWCILLYETENNVHLNCHVFQQKTFQVSERNTVGAGYYEHTCKLYFDSVNKKIKEITQGGNIWQIFICEMMMSNLNLYCCKQVKMNTYVTNNIQCTLLHTYIV